MSVILVFDMASVMLGIDIIAARTSKLLPVGVVVLRVKMVLNLLHLIVVTLI